MNPNQQFMLIQDTLTLHLFNNYFDRMTAPILQPSAEVASHLIMLYQPTNQTSAMVHHLLQMLPPGGNANSPAPRHQLARSKALLTNLWQ